MKWWQSSHYVAQKRMIEGLHSTGQDLDRKFWPAMVIFAVLGVVIWFTVGADKVDVFGRQIEMRWIPMFVIGTFVFRTVMARQAEKIRRGSASR